MIRTLNLDGMFVPVPRPEGERMRSEEDTFDSNEHQLGVKIEHEHKPTWDKLIASIKDGKVGMTEEEFYTGITEDHLKEIKDYNSRLLQMEVDAGANINLKKNDSGKIVDFTEKTSNNKNVWRLSISEEKKLKDVVG